MSMMSSQSRKRSHKYQTKKNFDLGERIFVTQLETDGIERLIKHLLGKSGFNPVPFQVYNQYSQLSLQHKIIESQLTTMG